ncbi:GNAT family N-acetyltransferase [cf. Phormidesmis sp. LEGE 11477]|uniref:GNAT family N-acetyltransferase n=1 Tax=cf. Phormidesmis sp. LEGE 11477 TaxID=1828680 RepID=UPI001880B17A|nr:GNAT family N-acetyltransferase [cf. Phormidesmis sp. LEGE 11477]MBE9061182.1 GNAT family N-acetyltransferase [cf. Phormidesmis sp. LEGE 11477]
MIIRAIEPSDWPFVWSLLEPTFRAGETYAFSPDICESEAYQVWVERPRATYVVVQEGVAKGTAVEKVTEEVAVEECDRSSRILGTYYIKANQPALGAHVCNCGYVVATAARGRGIATAMCEHSQAEARRLGFIAMQFNLVVSTNAAAVRLWQKLGFEIVGKLPKAFQHSVAGLVDAFVMYKIL